MLALMAESNSLGKKAPHLYFELEHKSNRLAVVNIEEFRMIIDHKHGRILSPVGTLEATLERRIITRARTAKPFTLSMCA